MKNLATTNVTDFTVTESGDAFISQTKVAELCGVERTAITNYVSRLGDTLNLNENNQLRYDSLELVTGYYAFESRAKNETALQTYRTLAKAGAKAYIYHLAGYEMKAEKPKTQIELIIESAQALQRIEAEQIEQRNQLRAVEKQVARLTGESTHMAILAWATNNGLKIPISKSASMGKQAKAHCILKGIEYGTVKDERYGSVYTYPEDVLDLLFKPA